MHKIINKTTELTYKNILKPILFTQDPETVHDRFTRAGEIFGASSLVSKLFYNLYCRVDHRLHTKVGELELNNPVGLAAGFDYNGYISKFLYTLDFGFNTIGTVTAKPYDGNARPRLLRLVKSKSLLVNKGFKSEGADSVYDRLSKYLYSENSVVGVSVGSTNIETVDTIDKAIEDYLYTIDKFKDLSSIKYIEINISCPNTKMKESFSSPTNLELLLSTIAELQVDKPLFIKLANEVSTELLSHQLELAIKYGVSGAILSNLVKDRNNKYLDKQELEIVKDKKGNFSGKPCQENSDKLIQFAYKNFGKSIDIIGVGGIFSAEDAYRKIRLGASAVQLITGLIFKGPQLVSQINRGLIDLVDRDGFKSIQDAIGSIG